MKYITRKRMDAVGSFPWLLFLQPVPFARDAGSRNLHFGRSHVCSAGSQLEKVVSEPMENKRQGSECRPRSTDKDPAVKEPILTFQTGPYWYCCLINWRCMSWVAV